MNLNYPIYIFFGLAPSFIWLLFFLRKDSHPESNPTILKIFFYGMLAAIPAALVEIGLSDFLGGIKILYVFLGIALVEEFFKYLVVRRKILNHSEFDEPVDIMLYMIISALGFSALENLLLLLPLAFSFQLREIFIISGFRFVGATFLHALCSGLLGYFWALSLSDCKNRAKLFLMGLFLATLLHGLYDLSIMEIENGFKFAVPAAALAILAILVFAGFKKVKKLKSICLQK